MERVTVVPVLPIAFLAAGLLAGLLIGRWWVVLAVLAVEFGLAAYLYVNNGWSGAGWGDFGIALNVLVAAATVLGAALGVGVRYAASGKARAQASG